jgi:hypothetical protein
MDQRAIQPDGAAVMVRSNRRQAHDDCLPQPTCTLVKSLSISAAVKARTVVV